MKSEEYISSGILELYVMGSLVDSQMEEVRQMADNNPEVAAELKKIEILIESYAQLNGIEPDASIKEKVLSSIKNEPLRIYKSNSPDSPSVQSIDPIKLIHSDQEGSSFYKYMAAASLALLIISSALNIFVWNKWSETRQELTALVNEKAEYANQLIQVKSSYDQSLAEISVLQNKEYRSIEMKGLPISPNSLVRVYWNQQTKETFVDYGNLPVPPPGMQYQLWALLDGKPVDAGVFNPVATLQKVKNVENAQAFAVTLEPAGGSLNPTMASLFVMGNV